MITLTGLLLIVVPIAFNVTFFLLQRAFEYPDILRKPTDYILRRFKEGGAPLRNLWYTFAFSAVLFTPVPVMVQQVFQPAAPWYLMVGTAMGVLAGAVQFLGLIRWPFLVPSLADIYTDPASTQATRDSAAVSLPRSAVPTASPTDIPTLVATTHQLDSNGSRDLRISH